MTNILALDTSGSCCSIALLRNNSQESNRPEILSRVHTAPREHTQRILPMIDELLAESNLSLSRLDALAFGRGPGSFTGLRIALSVVQGLAYGADIPVIPVSTLQAIAQQAWRRGWASSGDCVLTALDARMSEVYMGAYQIPSTEELPSKTLEREKRVKENSSVLRVLEPILTVSESVLAPADAVSTWQSQLDLPLATIKAVGDGWGLEAMQELAQNWGITVQIDSDAAKATPLAEDIAPLALNAFVKGETVDAMHAEPIYLRNEVTWKKRQRIRNA